MPKPTLNQADIELLKGIFATKDDVATIVEEKIRGFATKEDVAAIVEEKIQFFPTKFEMDRTIDSAIQASEKRLEKKYDHVITLLDGISGNIKSMQEELTMVQGHKDQLENHESRLQVVEAKLALTSN